MINPPNHHNALPRYARLPISRCNLPAAILGSLTYQRHPASLVIDGVHELYDDIFQRLAKLQNAVVRARHFEAFMSAQFQLNHPEQMGFEADLRLDRSKANYQKIMRGWFFNPDAQEGAVFKGWAESRFGLLPRFHRTPIRSPLDESYRIYEQERARGLYNTNALEHQLDLLFSYCQCELQRQYPGMSHLTLFRGINHIDEYESLDVPCDRDRQRPTLLLNNLNSFTSTAERACEFGDHVLQVEIPIYKVVCYSGLLPGAPASEDEYIVLGGLYRTRLIR